VDNHLTVHRRTDSKAGMGFIHSGGNRIGRAPRTGRDQLVTVPEGRYVRGFPVAQPAPAHLASLLSGGRGEVAAKLLSQSTHAA
jgi:hypothetical protein